MNTNGKKTLQCERNLTTKSGNSYYWSELEVQIVVCACVENLDAKDKVQWVRALEMIRENGVSEEARSDPAVQGKWKVLRSQKGIEALRNDAKNGIRSTSPSALADEPPQGPITDTPEDSSSSESNLNVTYTLEAIPSSQFELSQIDVDSYIACHDMFGETLEDVVDPSPCRSSDIDNDDMVGEAPEGAKDPNSSSENGEATEVVEDPYVTNVEDNIVAQTSERAVVNIGSETQFVSAGDVVALTSGRAFVNIVTEVQIEAEDDVVALTSGRAVVNIDSEAQLRPEDIVVVPTPGGTLVNIESEPQLLEAGNLDAPTTGSGGAFVNIEPDAFLVAEGDGIDLTLGWERENIDPEAQLVADNSDIDTSTVNSEGAVDTEFEAYFEQVSKAYKSFIGYARRRVERRRLPILNNLTKHEKRAADILQTAAWNSSVDKGLHDQWIICNESVYAVVLAMSKLRGTSESGHVKWLNNKEKEIKSVRQFIGWAVTISTLAEGTSPSRRQEYARIRVVREMRKLKSVDTKGFIKMCKDRLDILKLEVDQRVKDVARQQLRIGAGTCPNLMKLRKTRENGTTDDSGDLTVEEATQYWRKLALPGRPTNFSNPIVKDWINTIKSQCELPCATSINLGKAFDKASNWKAPGPDGIHNFYWKYLKVARFWLLDIHKKSLNETFKCPRWLCRGRTVLLYKAGDRKDPSKYRPITCLNTCYKLLTSSMATYMLPRVTNTVAFPEEQRALRKGQWACLIAQVKDLAMMLDASTQKNRKIHVAWIDQEKAFDSTPHDLIKEVIKSLNLPSGFTHFLLSTIDRWSTRIELRVRGKVRFGPYYRIRRGVFQGDSLSPLLFIIVTSVISYNLNKLRKVRPYTRSVSRHENMIFNHQLYVDDLKQYARDKKELQAQIRITQAVNSVLGMKINDSKSAATAVISLSGSSDRMLPHLGAGEAYKYLGIHQFLRTDWNKTIEGLKERVRAKCHEIFDNDLTIRQQVTLYNSTIAPMVSYVFMNAFPRGKFSSVLVEAKEIDMEIRQILKQYKVRFQSSMVNRLYIDSDKYGLGLRSCHYEALAATIVAGNYISNCPELSGPKGLFVAMSKRGKRNPLSDMDKGLVELEISDLEFQAAARGEEPSKGIRKLVHEKYQESLIRTLKEKGFYDRCVTKQSHIDWQQSMYWVKCGKLNAVSLRNAFAVQELQLTTRSHYSFNGVNVCRICKKPNETPMHILTECEHWLNTLITYRHDAIARNVYYRFCKYLKLEPIRHDRKIPSFQTTDSFELFWGFPHQTRKPLHHKRPDIVLIDKATRRGLVVEVACVNPENIQRVEHIKNIRYKVNGEEAVLPENYQTVRAGYSFCEDLVNKYRLRHCELAVIVVGVCGEVSKDSIKEMNKVLKFIGLENKEKIRKDLLERCQRSAVIGSSRIIKNHMVRE